MKAAYYNYSWAFGRVIAFMEKYPRASNYSLKILNMSVNKWTWLLQHNDPLWYGIRQYVKNVDKYLRKHSWNLEYLTFVKYCLRNVDEFITLEAQEPLTDRIYDSTIQLQLFRGAGGGDSPLPSQFYYPGERENRHGHGFTVFAGPDEAEGEGEEER